MNIPKWLLDKRNDLRDGLIKTEQGIIFFDLGWDECAKIMLTENRRVMALNQALLSSLTEIQNAVKRDES